jgi:hypothetical protein
VIFTADATDAGLKKSLGRQSATFATGKLAFSLDATNVPLSRRFS